MLVGLQLGEDERNALRMLVADEGGDLVRRDIAQDIEAGRDLR